MQCPYVADVACSCCSSYMSMALSQVKALRQELAATQDRVIYLSNELRSLRKNICESCKEKFAPSSPTSQAVASSSPAESSSRNLSSCSYFEPPSPESPNFWQLIWQRHCPSPAIWDGSPNSFGSASYLDIDSTFLIPFLSPSPSESIRVSLKQTHITKQSLTPLGESPSNGVSPSSLSSWSVKQHETVNATLDVMFARSFIHKGRIRSVRFSADGKHLAALLKGSTGHNTTGAIVFFDVETGEKTCELAEYASQYSPKERFNVLCMSFGTSGRYLVVGDTAGRVTVWDIPNRRIRNIFRGHTNSVESVDFSPNGQLIVSASGDKTVRVWNTRDGHARVFSDSAQGLLSARFSPNGQYVAAGNSGGVLMIWNLRTDQLLDKWSGHRRVVLSVAFTPDGKGLVSGSGDGVVKYWDISSLGTGGGGSAAREILEYKSHTSVIKCVAISPDAQWLASTSYDKTAILWDTHSAVRQCTLVGHEDAVVSVDFSPAGTYLATGSQDGHVTLWRVY